MNSLIRSIRYVCGEGGGRVCKTHATIEKLQKEVPHRDVLPLIFNGNCRTVICKKNAKYAFMHVYIRDKSPQTKEIIKYIVALNVLYIYQLPETFYRNILQL